MSNLACEIICQSDLAGCFEVNKYSSEGHLYLIDFIIRAHFNLVTNNCRRNKMIDFELSGLELLSTVYSRYINSF